jgi:DNA-binding transcriptional LysR family regulator
MDTLLSMKVFRQVAELRSFSRAADRLDLSPAMVSKHVMHLEQRLGTRLLNRSSRHVSLTEMGALYYEQSSQMLDALENVEAAVSRTAVVAHGTLRMSVPVWMASAPFAKLLADFRALHPQVQFDIDLSGRHVNLIDEGFDLALRVTDVPDESLVARPLTRIRFHLVAAPAWLQRTGCPQTLADLDGRDLLLCTHSPLGGPLTVDGPNGAQTIRFNPVLKSSNETLLHLAALQGLGCAFLPKFFVEEDLAAGRLEIILPDRVTSHVTLLGVYPGRKFLSAKVSAFIDFVAGAAAFE